MSSNSKSKSLSRLGRLARELVAATVWLLAFIKLFVFDIDIILVDHFAPQLHRFLQYRLFIIISGVALSWIILGNRRFRIFVAYVLFYPLILVLWRLPKLAFKNWATAVVFAPALESLITTFKWRFIASSLTMLAALTIVISSQPYILIAAMIILLAYLVAHYMFRFSMAFRSTTFFANLGGTIRTIWEGLLSNFRKTEMQDLAKLDPISDEVRKKRAANLQMVLVYTIVLRSFARKLQGVFSSRKTDLYFLGALLYSFVLTLVLFAFEYFALYKAQRSSFPSTGIISFWTFLLFSFNVIIHAGFASLTPASRVAILFANLELLAGIVIFVIFVFVLLTSNRERYRQDLKVAIDKLEEGVQQIAGFIQDEFKLTVLEAEATILESNPGFSQVIVFLGGTPPSLPNPPSTPPTGPK